MTGVCENIEQIKREIGNVQLVVVSKYRSLDELQEVLDCGHLDLGENRVQELLEKSSALSSDIRWHVIGHLQRNKVKYIIPFVHLIHSVDSLRLLTSIEQEAAKADRIISVLLQVHIAEEDSKFGFKPLELDKWLSEHNSSDFPHVRLKGLMGMATLTEDNSQIRREFKGLRKLYEKHRGEFAFDTLSMGMSSDYRIAVECGSTMVRIGSSVFEH